MTLQASLPCSAVNVPDDFFYMAGFEVTLYGRIWVSAEGKVTSFTLKRPQDAASHFPHSLNS